MSAHGLDPALRVQAARNLLLDRLSAEVAGAFRADGIASLLLKGPALADWLYPGEVRPYLDSDLLVTPDDWERAVGVLNRLGFRSYRDPLTHPPIESAAATEFLRDGDNVDLHRTLPGLEGRPDAVARALIAGADHQRIGGTELRVPNRAALVLNVALHAAHHGKGRPVEDLRRAIAFADDQLWRSALDLAQAFDGVPAFASGLRLLPEGVALARRLGIASVRSARHELRRQDIPTAEGLDALLSQGLGTRRRIRIVVREFFPGREFLRSWTPLARRGRAGLAAAYVWRGVWLLLHAPRAVVALWRVRRIGPDG